MKWALLIFALIGIALIVFGYRLTVEPGQSVNVQMGGLFPIAFGVIVLAATAIVGLIYAVVA